MADKQKRDNTALPEDVAQNPGAREVAMDTNPKVAQEEARNAAAGESPNATGGGLPSTAAEHVPASSSPEPSDLPSGNEVRGQTARDEEG